MRTGLLLVTIVCLLIFIEENDATRFRLPGLKISATFRKTAAYIKKKLNLDTNKSNGLNVDEAAVDDNAEL